MDLDTFLLLAFVAQLALVTYTLYRVKKLEEALRRESTPEGPTNWANVKPGTPVLFRRTENSDYQAGEWYKCGDEYCQDNEQFWWAVSYDGIKGYFSSPEGATFVPISGDLPREWHIDPFWCKLA